MQRAWLFIGVAVLGAAAGAMFAQWRSTDLLDSESAEVQEMVGQKRPDYTLGASDGQRVSAADFDGDVVLVNFWATWCAPCKAIAPVVEAVGQDMADVLEVGKLDIDANMATANKYGVRNLPTLILFKGGEPVDQLGASALTKEKLAGWVNKHA